VVKNGKQQPAGVLGGDGGDGANEDESEGERNGTGIPGVDVGQSRQSIYGLILEKVGLEDYSRNHGHRVGNCVAFDSIVRETATVVSLTLVEGETFLCPVGQSDLSQPEGIAWV
jgi:hypothetical protein